MAYKFNPFTGTFDDVADIAEKVESSSGSSTDNAIVRWDGATGLLVQDSSVTINDSGDMVIAGDLQVNGTTTTVNTATLDVTDANITVNNTGNQATANASQAGITVEMSDATDAIIGYNSSLASKFEIGEIGSEAEIADVSSTQTFTNKTLTAPVISTISNTGTLTLPTSTDTLVGRNTTDTLTNKTLTSPTISSIENGGTLTLPSGVDTIVARNSTDTLTNKTLTAPVISTIVNTGTLTLPTSTDTLVGRATTDTLTNKTLVAASNTITTAASGNLTSTELNAALAELQTDIDTRSVITDVFSVNSNSGVFTAAINETYIVDTSAGTATITLPAASTDTFVRIKDSGNAENFNITIQTPGAETIDGQATHVINSDYGSVVIVSDGSNFYIL